jgi:peptide-methionine (S)-S-oxide reductase
MSLKSAALAFLAFALAMPVGQSMAETRSAIFAGGCFWCVEKDFDHVAGVVATTAGYSGGTLENPTYENHEGHREAVKVDYDSAKVDYATLVGIFLHAVDPTDAGGQFCDRGHAYTTAIYTGNDEEKAAAEKAKAEAQAQLGQPVVTPIEAAGAFWTAEDYHQDYYKKNPVRYKYYRYSCGRDARVDEVWGAAAHQGIDGF